MLVSMLPKYVGKLIVFGCAAVAAAGFVCLAQDDRQHTLVLQMLREKTTAAGLAAAAQSFGQVDDITVLTVARSAAIA